MFTAPASIGFGSTLLTWLVLGYVLALLLTVLLAGYVARSHWETQIGRVFTALVASFSLWIFGSLLRLFATTPEAFIAISTIKYLGIVTAPVWFVLFALLYSGKDRWVTLRLAAGLLVVPALELLALATTLSHGLLYAEIVATSLGTVPILDANVGPAFWFFATYGWGLLVVGSVVFVSAAIRRSGLYRAQSALVVLAIVISWAANLAYVLWGWPHPALDPTPFGFAVTSLLLSIGIFGTRLIDVVPAARSLVLDTIDDGVLVIDPKGRIVDMNETARHLFDDDRPIGKLARDVLPATILEPAAASQTIDLGGEGEPRQYRHRRIPIGPDGTYGRVIVLTDVTSQVRLQRDLERRNEQLEEFASVVSHDLKNPLNVAKGNLQLVREEYESDRLDVIARAHDRMETLIEELLVNSRQGRLVGSADSVDVGTVAERAWDSVPSGGASLELADGFDPIRADDNGLAQLFENLFTNAIEHGGPGVTVRVGPLDGGFYVEDDGGGIPPDAREALFERGYSTKASGTGYGLAIVRSIVDAHGWTVTATDGTEGGARFEVTGVDFAAS